MILKPLQRIQVLASTKKCQAGSIGYFVSQDNIGNYNGWDMGVIFSRFGYKGKPRIDLVNIHPRMVEYDNMSERDQKIIRAVGAPKGLDTRPYRGKNTLHLGDTKLTTIPVESMDLLDLDDNEFTAYVVALSLFIYRHKYGVYVGALHRALRAVDEGRLDLTRTEPSSIGHTIMKRIKNPDFAVAYAGQISTKTKKRNLLNRLRKDASMLKNELLRHKLSIESKFARNVDKIDTILRYYRTHADELHEKVKREKQRSGQVDVFEDMFEV